MSLDSIKRSAIYTETTDALKLIFYTENPGAHTIRVIGHKTYYVGVVRTCCNRSNQLTINLKLFMQDGIGLLALWYSA